MKRHCQECSGLIPAKRLAAHGDATRCRPCQERYEAEEAELHNSPLRMLDGAARQRLEIAIALHGELDGEVNGLQGGRG